MFGGCWVLRSRSLFFKQKTAYEMRISDWSSDVCSSDLKALRGELQNLVVDGEIAAFERHVRAAEFGGFAQEFERDSADMLFAEMAEFADRRHQRARRHAA